jgi:beta-phosphoglucomutase
MREIKAVIFDLDGVIVSTDEFHFQAWKQLADEEGIPFDRWDNERLRGVSRTESLEILLEKSSKQYSAVAKQRLAAHKNDIYRRLLRGLSPADVLRGVTTTLQFLRERGTKIAIGSSSKNAMTILRAIGMAHTFDVVTDGNHIARSKPDPEVFTLTAQRLGVLPEECLVVEDADAGVEAGLAAGMSVLAVGPAKGHPKATFSAENLAGITPETLLLAAVVQSQDRARRDSCCARVCGDGSFT